MTNHGRLAKTKSVLVALVSVWALTSCSEDITIRIEKTGANTIFHFGTTTLLSNNLKSICLRMIEVRGMKTEEVIWKIVKKGNKCELIKSATLGSKILGFSEQINRLPLKQGQNYVVSIIADEGSVTSDGWNA